MRGSILDLCATRAGAEGTHPENVARLWSSKSPFKAPGRLAQSKHFGSRGLPDKSKRESEGTDQLTDSGISLFKMIHGQGEEAFEFYGSKTAYVLRARI